MRVKGIGSGECVGSGCGRGRAGGRDGECGSAEEAAVSGGIFCAATGSVLFILSCVFRRVFDSVVAVVDDGVHVHDERDKTPCVQL